MSKQELISKDIEQQYSHAELAAMVGQQTSAVTLTIPMLKINKDHEDTEGRIIPAGTYQYTGLDGHSVYGKPATFRPFLQAYQYRVWDDAAEKYTNQSVIFTDFRHDAPDELGGNKCGKVPNKLKDQLSKEQLEVQEQISCTRLLFGLVSFDGVKADGTKLVLHNSPVLWRHGGTAFVPVGDAIQSLNKGASQRLMFNFNFNLETERAQKGATKYYTPVLSVDLKKTVEFTNADFETLSGFRDYVKGVNEGVIKKFEANLAKKTRNSVDSSSGKTVAEILGADFEDELPPNMTVISAA